MSLHISVSSLQDFMTCRRLYYYKRIKKYERPVFSIPFLVGRVVHLGMNYLLEKKPNAIELMTKYFQGEKKNIRNTFTLTEKQEHDLNEQEFVIKGMLAAYTRKYGKMLRDTKLLGSEVEGSLQFDDDVIFVLKLDNIVLVRAKKILHELKTSKDITPDYVKRIRTDMQTAIYFYFHNIIFEDDKIDEVMYDIIRKPSIRQKKTESYPMFLQRLSVWYDETDGEESVFHIERFKKPGIEESDIINTVQKVSDEMLRCKTKEDYYQDYDKCHSYFGDVCPMYELCHEGGETKENLVLYQIRKPYHVSKENKGVKR